MRDNSVIKAGTAVSRASRRCNKTGDLEAAKLHLAEVKIQRYITETLAAAPPLKPEQLDRLAALLRPVDDAPEEAE